MGQRTGTPRILMGKREVTIQLGRPGRRRKDNIKKNLCSCDRASLSRINRTNQMSQVMIIY
jgi:hypothetical protein